MARKKGLKKYSRDELVAELAHRNAESEYRDGMTMDDVERIAERIKGEIAEKSLRAMLSRIPPEKSGGRACPRCPDDALRNTDSTSSSASHSCHTVRESCGCTCA